MGENFHFRYINIYLYGIWGGKVSVYGGLHALKIHINMGNHGEKE